MTLLLSKISSPDTSPTLIANDRKLKEVLDKHYSAIFKGLGKLKNYAVELNISDNAGLVAEPQGVYHFIFAKK